MTPKKTVKKNPPKSQISRSRNVKTKTNNPSSKSNSKNVFIEIDNQKVQELSENISHQNLSYDDFVWKLAEDELMLTNVFGKKKNVFSERKDRSKISVNPTKLKKSPSQDQIRNLAKELSQKGYSIQDLHWLIAEREIILDGIKKK